MQVKHMWFKVNLPYVTGMGCWIYQSNTILRNLFDNVGGLDVEK